MHLNYRSMQLKSKATASLLNANTGRAIFPATMTSVTFSFFTYDIPNRVSRIHRWEHDKLAAVWESFVPKYVLIDNC